ncbi:DEAD/DEAH box helicase [Haloprofundus halobius]|uniref:DEAD/DEAH box helicase n=1 Tax=Haloprofundus halobius TaxID=2876194 RepID=UPI001CC9A10A|nr:DEAD/DEAH box helicase [Haloprofundus halobius]
MRVRDLPLSDELVAHYEAQGIDELYPPQAAAVEAGVCDGGGVVAAIPTASGKTFIAELAMLTADGPGLYVVPLRALAREKYEAFAELPGVEAGISTGDFDSPGEELADYDVVVATSEKVDSAIRNGASWVEKLACVVVDEVHLLGAEGRGPTLEVTLATLQRRAPGLQIVALSATVDNPEDIADWLDAELVRNRWRPIDLRTGVYCEERVRFDDGTDLTVDCDSTDLPPSADADTEATAALVADAVDNGGQALAFVRSRREAESLARRLAQDGLGSASAVADEVLDAGATETGERLADALESGVAFHHAGLRSDHRVAVENGFRNRDISVICATPTLAAGVNVPARRVVIRDQKRYTGSEMAWLPVLEVHQMCGRAGRPHLDPYGEAVLVGDENTRDELRTRYVEAEPEAVESKLADPEALRTHVLSVVASEFADSRESILDLLGATFYAHQTPDMDLSGVVDAVISDLVSMEMVIDEEALSATELGAQVSRQYLSPETGARIVSGLRTAARMETTTELTALEIVCDTPDMHGTYLGNRERAAMYQYATKHAAEFTTKMGETENFERWLEAVKTARILHDWAEDVPARDIVDAYRIGPGDLESRIERAEWLLGGADALSNVVGVSMPELSSVRARL